MGEISDILFWSSGDSDANAPSRRVIVVYDQNARRSLSQALYGFIDKLKRELGHGQHNELVKSGLPIPLILTPRPASRTEGGLAIPAEFVISVNEMDGIHDRVKALSIVHSNGITSCLLRAMCAGAFRKHLCMDDDNHSTGEMDPYDLAQWVKSGQVGEWKDKDGNFWPCVVHDKIEELRKAPESDAEAVTFKLLFKNEIEAIDKSMEAVKKIAEGKSEVEEANSKRCKGKQQKTKNSEGTK